MDHLRETELIVKRQFKIIYEFIPLLLSRSGKIKLKEDVILILTLPDLLRRCSHLLNDDDIFTISDNILSSGLLVFEDYTSIKYSINNIIYNCFNEKIINSFNSGYTYSHINTKLFIKVFNLPEIKKLWIIIHNSKFWRLSDEEFVKILNDAITIVKTIELFE